MLKLITQWSRKHHHNSRAQAMVEFALILPILLLLIIAIIDFGRALFIYSQVSNSAREAVRFGAGAEATDPTTKHLNCTGIQNRARSMFSLAPSTLAVTVFVERPNAGGGFDKLPCATTAVANGDRVRVEVRATISLLALELFGPIFRGAIPSNWPIGYDASRSIVPGKGFATGPTTTPRPTKTLVGATNTPTPTDTPTPVPTPQQVTNFQVTSTCTGPNRIDASWTAVAGATSYIIFDASNNTQVASANAPATSANNIGTVAGNASRSFYIVAYNQTVPGSISAIVTVTCGAAPSLTPSLTPTNTPTRTPTPTPSNTPTHTPTPSNTPTITPGPSPTPTNTPTPVTPTRTPSPTATPRPIRVQWVTDTNPPYPVRMGTGSNKQAFFKVKVTFTDGTPIDTAIVRMYDTSTNPVNYLANMSALGGGTGEYGRLPATVYGDCFNVSITQDYTVEIIASYNGASAILVGTATGDFISACP